VRAFASTRIKRPFYLAVININITHKHNINITHMKCKPSIQFMFSVPRYPFSPDQDIPVTDWEVYLRETANAIVSQQSPQRSQHA